MKLIALNKPFQVLSQFRQDGQHQTLADFIFDSELRIAGRLDYDSEGLLLLTDHGVLNQYISNPKHKQWKTYIVQVDGQVTDDAISALQQGVLLNDGLTLPAQVRQIEEPEWLWTRTPPIRFRANIPTSWLEIKICEGRNRQVRRMTASVGFPTLRLIRKAIGSIDLCDLNLALGQSMAVNFQHLPEFQAFKTLQQQSKRPKAYPVQSPSPSRFKRSSSPATTRKTFKKKSGI